MNFEALDFTAIREQFAGIYKSAHCSYSTIRDYHESCKILTPLCTWTNDLKDVQRSWVVKAILGSIPLGGNLLEIGAGRPFVAEILTRLGYNVVVVDPYDGSGKGPTSYDSISRSHPNIHFIRDVLTEKTPSLQPCSYDAVYSISVIEHIAESDLSPLGRAIDKFLKHEGVSFHAIDVSLCGTGAKKDLRRLDMISEHLMSGITTDFGNVFSMARDDPDTFFLSPQAYIQYWYTAIEKYVPYAKQFSLNIMSQKK